LVGVRATARVWLSRHDEPPFVQQNAKTIQNQLTWKSLLPVHEVADEDEEDNKYVEVYERGQEEVVDQKQECLCPVSALNRADDTCCFDGARGVCGLPESHSIREDGHNERMSRSGTGCL
jgi:hypothetical protein